MAKTWEQITTILSEAKFKLPRDQKEVKKQTERVAGKTLDIRFGEDKRGKIHVYIDGVLQNMPYSQNYWAGDLVTINAVSYTHLTLPTKA